MSALEKTYRVYCYDREKKIVTADFIQAASDDEAIAKASQRGFGSMCEIWDGTRLVAQLEGELRTA